MPPNLLPSGVQPKLGPDATGVGQVMWYLLEGRDAHGNPTGGWDLHELRSVQDWTVRYALLAVEGISEVASVGGFVREFQVDVDPILMRANGVTLEEVVTALKRANIDVGASTIEVNKVEYIVRGLGFIKNTEDIENTVIKSGDTVPVFVRNIANVTHGPASRSGALDKGGAETAGGIVVVRHGVNPLEALKNVRAKIEEITPGLPRKVLADGTESQLHVIPFYDRSNLIYETLGTLQDAISEEILVAIIVILLVMMHLESSLLISAVLPLAVLISFIAMKIFGVDANIVALSGIAIAIGTLDDMGIVICENIQRHLTELKQGDSRLHAVFRAASEVGGAVLAAAAATIVSFLPVFALEGAEGKLFRPLAFTKTFALIGSAVIAVMVIPVLAEVFFAAKEDVRKRRWLIYESLIYLGAAMAFMVNTYLGIIVAFIGFWRLLTYLARGRAERWLRPVTNLLAAAAVALVLARHWLPFGPEKGLLVNFMFVAILVGGLVGFFLLVQHYYSRILGLVFGPQSAVPGASFPGPRLGRHCLGGIRPRV